MPFENFLSLGVKKQHQIVRCKVGGLFVSDTRHPDEKCQLANGS